MKSEKQKSEDVLFFTVPEGHVQATLKRMFDEGYILKQLSPAGLRVVETESDTGIQVISETGQRQQTKGMNVPYYSILAVSADSVLKSNIDLVVK